MLLIFTVIFTALVFEFINGFHDTANSIATVVSTKVLTPRQAIVMAAATNLLGALWGTAVAKTIAAGLVDTNVVTSQVLICALLGGISWNLITWYVGLPSSSSHALIGGLCGAALAAAKNNWNVIIWSQPSSTHWFEGKGLLWKVVVPMALSPLAGFVISFVLMAILYMTLRSALPSRVRSVFNRLQIASAAGMGFMHGTNDAQKTMGVIALALYAGTAAGDFSNLPWWLSFLRMEDHGEGLTIHAWIKVVCALTMAAGTAAGGWKIIKTIGHQMVKLQPIHGFAAETSSSICLAVASHFGIPVSTTHNISCSILGVGAAKNLNNIRWTVVERMVWAWFLTIPCAGIVAYTLMLLF
jgi:PiT family inorganic phosphate transporter